MDTSLNLGDWDIQEPPRNRFAYLPYMRSLLDVTSLELFYIKR